MTSSTSSTTTAGTGDGHTESADLLAALRQQRDFLRFAVRGLTDTQATTRTTISELTLGGLVKHVTEVERSWVRFILEGPSAMGNFSEFTEEDWQRRADDFRLLEGETLEGVLEEYGRVALRTGQVVGGLSDLSATQPLPEAPWYEPGARWSARQVLVHVLAETAQHCGHADIIREALDGQKTMG